jgi:hypothetical protein
MPESIAPLKISFRYTGGRIAALLFCLLALMPAATLSAADLDLSISQKALQNFFDAALPYHLNYQPIPGAMAADIVISNPRVILEPGRPGRVFVEVDYLGESQLLGLEPFTGQSRPEVHFAFDPKRSALRLQFSEMRIQAGEKLKFNLDGIIDPLYLPLAPDRPLEVGQDQIVVKPGNVRIEVTNRGLRLSLDYRFERRQARGPSPKP